VRILPVTLASPSREPVTLEQLRGHVRVDDSADDRLLRSYLVAARERAESILGRPIVPRTVRATFERWPCAGDAGFWLSGAGGWGGPSFPQRRDQLVLGTPVSSIDAIRYTDTTQTQVAWTGFIARTSPGEVTRVRPATGQDWPTLGIDPVITLDATAGFVIIPEAIVAAILLIAAHFYLNREEVLTGTRLVAIQLPLGAGDLLAPYRWRWIG
jgi:hypothetical protein